MLIEWFLSIKSLPNLLFGVLCLPGDQSHPFAQPTINPLACCICWAGLLGRAVFPPWNEGPNSGSYSWKILMIQKSKRITVVNSLTRQERMKHAQLEDFDLARGKDSSNGVTGRNLGNRDSNANRWILVKQKFYADCFTSSIKQDAS